MAQGIVSSASKLLRPGTRSFLEPKRGAKVGSATSLASHAYVATSASGEFPIGHASAAIKSVGMRESRISVTD
jgi:hypothetical protein